MAESRGGREDEMKGVQHHGTAEVSRRAFLGYVVGAIGGFMTLAAGIPIVGSFVSPIVRGRNKGGSWVKLGGVESFTSGEPKFVQFSLSKQDGWVASRFPKSVWAVRQQNGEFVCYNSRCTHLGCIVDWKDSGMGGELGWNFYSPCHGGVFTIGGKVIAGPPPRPLDRLDYKIEDGELLVNYVDFQLGVPEKKPL